MARLSYDSVEALIYDPVSANRTATRAALYSLGLPPHRNGLDA